ncbi:MAG: hypothetical protein LW600_06720 [Ilumatobacteraceae bacterium]|jgi:hypothetical protein|nr:hypothetical protein [Ilumatobacteraceae bacterium]
MPDTSSSSSPDLSTTTELPRQFTLFLKNSDFGEVVMAAVRHAQDSIADSTFTVQFTPTHCMWWFRRQNVNMYLSTADDGEERPHAGVLTLPVHFFDSIRQLLLDDEEIDVELQIDLNANTITYSSHDCTFSSTLPQQLGTTPPALAERSTRIIVNAPQIAQIGPFLRSVPIALPEDEDGSPYSGHLPFVTFTYDGVKLTVTRDWSRLDGPTLSITVPAGGDYRGSFSVFAPVFAQEIYLSDTYTQGALTFAFNDEQPNICHVSSPRFGMVVELGYEHVLQYRTRIEVALHMADAEFEVARDTRRGWNPTVVINAGAREVTATIVPAQDQRGVYIRLDTEIAADVQWSTELATEINSWNDQWPTVKLVFVNNAVRAIADLPAAGLDGIADVVVDLVAKAQIVNDLIGAVL